MFWMTATLLYHVLITEKGSRRNKMEKHGNHCRRFSYKIFWPPNQGFFSLDHDTLTCCTNVTRDQCMEGVLWLCGCCEVFRKKFVTMQLPKWNVTVANGGSNGIEIAILEVWVKHVSSRLIKSVVESSLLKPREINYGNSTTLQVEADPRGSSLGVPPTIHSLR